MSVQEALRYQPKGDNMLAAFSWANDSHLTIGNTREQILRVPDQKIAQAASDYFTTGVAYLANHGHDAYMKELGTVTWWTVNQKRALTLFTDNMRGATMALGINPNVVHDETEPHVFYGASNKGKSVEEIAYVLLPPEFILKAKKTPIEGLATMAWIGSQIRDMANGRITKDPQYISPRAIASEAHLLHEAVERHPDIMLDPYYSKIMTVYPEGIASLPREARYRGFSGSEFMSAGLN